MPLNLHHLSARAVATAKGSALLSDGGGLRLRVSDKAAKSWVIIHRVRTKRSEIGLGSRTGVSLAKARKVAAESGHGTTSSTLSRTEPLYKFDIERYSSFSN